jgi:hypothetical protein
MVIESPISDNIIGKALIQLASNTEFKEKMDWWLVGAHSAERWLQFEFAFQLNRCLQGNYGVLCEKKWHDIVVVQYPLKNPYDASNEHIAVVELKWLGNWFTKQYVFNGINSDIVKIKNCSLPGIVLVVWLCVEPKKTSRYHEWICKALKQGIGVASPAIIEKKMLEKCNDKFKQIAKQQLTPTENFDSLELIAYIYRNQL